MRISEATTDRYPAGLLPSLMVLGVVVAYAQAGLASAENWPKVLRVTAAAATYCVVLLVLCRRQPDLRIGAFITAGAAAGIVSGLTRPSISLAVTRNCTVTRVCAEPRPNMDDIAIFKLYALAS